MPPDYSGLDPDHGLLRDQLIATEREFIRLDIADTAPVHPWQTQVGGQPYLVDAAEFPRDRHGEPMAFLIQLNFADLPPLNGYPSEGLLQSFVGTDDVFGMGYGQSPDQFHIRFHPTVGPGWIPHSALPALEGLESTPLYRPSEGLAVTGTLDRMPVLYGDDRFDTLFPDAPEDLTDRVCEVLGSRVGGYPWFCQYDDRDPAKDVLLLQLDSDGGSMEWGDGGAAHFFISEDDLSARRFSAVQYTWNCR